MDWENIFVNTSDEGLLSKISKELGNTLSELKVCNK